MTDLKFNILEQIVSSTPANPFHKSEFMKDIANLMESEAAFKDLSYEGFIRSAVGSDVLTITSAGRIAYETAKEEREKQTQNKRQQRFNNKISVASVLIPCITFILGIVIGHFSGIIEWIVSLFP
ncbi:MAG: hypothetical protein IK954_02510 [Clostridia bacterium]|nr:hypothetical protein [Clostridia bacterium]